MWTQFRKLKICANVEIYQDRRSFIKEMFAWNLFLAKLHYHMQNVIIFYLIFHEFDFEFPQFTKGMDPDPDPHRDFMPDPDC